MAKNIIQFQKGFSLQDFFSQYGSEEQCHRHFSSGWLSAWSLNMKQLGFLDFDIRLACINKAGDSLVQLNDTVDWEIFRSILEERGKAEKIESRCQRV